MAQGKYANQRRSLKYTLSLVTMVLMWLYFSSWDELQSDRGGFVLPEIRRENYLDQLVEPISIITGDKVNVTAFDLKGSTSSNNGFMNKKDTTNNIETANSKRHCPSTPNYGPIRRIQHMSKQTNGRSAFKVFGTGLHWAKVGESTVITVKVPLAKRAKFHTRTFISVLAVGQKHIFYASPFRFNSKNSTLSFRYFPKFPGNYTLFVEEISSTAQFQLPGSPFTLYIDGPPMKEEEIRMKADRLPSCQTLSQTKLSWSYGHWVTRELAGDKRGTLRSGWVLQPNHCSIDIFTKRDLELAASSSTLKTIVILGRSTERGVFLSLVDILLRKEEKADMYTSVLWKCWGYMEVRLGNIRFIYQDFRIEDVPATVPNDDNHVNITCHDMKVIRRNDYFSNTIIFFRKLLSEDISPDVILMIMTNPEQLSLLAETIPPSWGGSLFVMNGFKVHNGLFYTFQGRNDDLANAKNFVGFDKHILNLDGFALATPWRHATEIPPLIMKTAHWHRTCNEQNGEIQVCGDATEMVGQILLGKALTPRGKDVWLKSFEKCKSGYSEMTPRYFTVCDDCPKSVFPLNFNPVPHLKCGNLTSLKIRNMTGVTAYKAPKCPSECMKTKPRSKTHQVRLCTMFKSDKNDISYGNLTIT